MTPKIIPCLKDFSLDQENVCNLCQSKILTEREVNTEKFDPSGSKCVKTTVNNLYGGYLSHPSRTFAFAALIAFGTSLFTLDANAQEAVEQMQDTIVPSTPATEEYVEIRGQLFDEETMEPLIFAKVFVGFTGNYLLGCQTDFDGYFKLKVKPYEIAYILEHGINFSYVGYTSKKIEVQKSDLKLGHLLDLGEIKLEDDSCRIIVGIMIYEPVIDKDPDAHRSTKIKFNEIKRSPYRK